MSARKNIPITFVPQLALGESALFDALGLNDPRDGRTPLAKKKAAYRFCALHGIKPLPGRVFPLRKIERVLST